MKITGTLGLAALLMAGTATFARAEFTFSRSFSGINTGHSGLGGGGGIAVNAAGNVVFGAASTSTGIGILNTSTGAVTTYADSTTIGAAVVSVTVDNSGTIWAAADGYSGIWALNPSTGVFTQYNANQTTYGWHNSMQVAFDNAGNYFAADFVANRIVQFTPNPNPTGNNDFLTSSTVYVGAFDTHPKPRGVAVDDSGNVYFSNENGQVGTYNINNLSAGISYQSLGSLGSSSGLFTRDSQGNIYVAMNNGIQELQSNGTWSTVFSSSAHSNIAIQGIAFDTAGNLFVANGSTVQEFAAPAPEPGTIGLGAAALGALVWFRRRKV